MECYLDNSATTGCCKAATDKMVELLTKEFGNPSSMHQKGVDAENEIKLASERIAATLKVLPKEITFTSGGTESNNLAILGIAAAMKRSGMHVITTQIEHASVSNPFKALEEDGFEVTYLSVDELGHISMDELKNAVREDTILVSVMFVNNEIGAVEPIEEIGTWLKKNHPNVVFHVDAIQAYGKLMIRPKKMGIDLLSVSGHKIHGPKGSGFLYIREKLKIRPIIYGGGQQKGLRSGTENVPAIAGLGVASEEIYTDHEKKVAALYELRDYFIREVTEIPGVTVNGAHDHTNVCHIVSVSVEGVRSEVLLHALEDKQVYVSAGSACSSNKPAVSSTLKAIGLKNALLDSTVRFSFSVNTTKEELDYALDTMRTMIPMLQKYTRH